MNHDLFDTRVRTAIDASRVQRQAPLSAITTFRVGGPADWIIDVISVDELIQVLASARDSDVPVTVIGGGSNVVAADAGVRGAILRLRLTTIEQPSADRVRVGAGVTINGLVRWLISHGLAGLEQWAGTPGTVGGAIYGNAHFAGTNIGDLVSRVGLMTTAGECVEVVAADMGFAYDTSRLRETREILVWAEFAVSTGETETLRRAAKESLAYRKRTQPLALPSAGCMFQNPDRARDPVPAGVPASAGALVDRAGLKGARVGGALISPTHANFIVNDGRATAGDIRALVEMARTAVRAQFGVELRDEVVFLGDFSDTLRTSHV